MRNPQRPDKDRSDSRLAPRRRLQPQLPTWQSRLVQFASLSPCHGSLQRCSPREPFVSGGSVNPPVLGTQISSATHQDGGSSPTALASKATVIRPALPPPFRMRPNNQAVSN